MRLMPLSCLHTTAGVVCSKQLVNVAEHEDWDQQETTSVAVSKQNKIHWAAPLTLTNQHVVSYLLNLCVCNLCRACVYVPGCFLATSRGSRKTGQAAVQRPTQIKQTKYSMPIRRRFLVFPVFVLHHPAAIAVKADKSEEWYQFLHWTQLESQSAVLQTVPLM